MATTIINSTEQFAKDTSLSSFVCKDLEVLNNMLTHTHTPDLPYIIYACAHNIQKLIPRHYLPLLLSLLLFALSSPLQAQNKTEVRSPLFALKTNLLFDAATILNAEIEVPLSPRWSVGAEAIFPWWTDKDWQNAIQINSANLELKYWLGNRITRPRMTGWFLGLYAGGGLYDLEYNHKGYQGEFFIATGLSSGFAHTINRSGTLRMEYSLGVGYLKTEYRYYEAQHSSIDHQWHLIRQHNGAHTWIGPTKLKVSLVWTINRKQKGGKR